MNHTTNHAHTTKKARLAPDDGVFELPGDEPTWIWAHTCPTENCQCRVALVLTTQDGRDALLERGAAVREAWNTGGDYYKVAESLSDLIAFRLEIDANLVLSLNDASPLDLAAHPRIADIAQRIDGDLLDALGRLWYRGKGWPDPEQQVLRASTIKIDRRSDEMLAWNDIFEGVRRDLYALDGHLYKADEMYCPAPDCTCGEILVHFEAIVPPGRKSPGSVLVQKSGLSELRPENAGAGQLEQLWSAFQQRHPNYLARFARRYPVMKDIGTRIVTTQTVVRTAPKAGRNDPCPCGSGKKYKKCCETH